MWPDARVAEAIGAHLVEHEAALGAFAVNHRHVGIVGAGWRVKVQEASAGGGTVEVSVPGDGRRWTVPVNEDLAVHVAAVAGELLPVLLAQRQRVSEESLRPGDRLVAVQGRWGIPKGVAFTVVAVISHRGHDPVTTYELDGPGVPRRVEVPHGDGDVGTAWRRA